MAYRMTTVNGNPVIPNCNYAVVVGGGSKGAIYLAECFEKYSPNYIDCIHLRTKDALKNGHKTYVKRFKQMNIIIVAICPLTDSLIPFCDAMCKIFNIPYNDPKTSEIRRNKALMHKTISESHQNKMDKVKNYIKNIINKQKDSVQNDDSKNDENKINQVRYGKFFEINNYLTSKKEFEQQMLETDLSYPIVIKPPTSGGTDGVRLCYTFEAAQKVVKKYLYEENSEKNKNISMMCQEFLDGDEYVINSVSYDSNHKITDIWRAHKTFICDKWININKSNKQNDIDEKNENISTDTNDILYPYSMLYDYQQFIVNTSDTKMEFITNYVYSILDILGVKYGCGHTEVIYLTGENKVCLCELNARCGGGIPRAKDLVGYDQYGLLALSNINSNRFIKEIPMVYGKGNSGNVNFNVYGNLDDEKNINNDVVTVRVVFLQSKVNGTYDFMRLEELKNELKTFYKWARELVYVDIELWMKYKLKLMLTEQKLEMVIQTENDKYAQMDVSGFININDEEMDFLEEQKNECRQEMSYFKRTIGKIEEVQKTVDLVTSPGAIVLKGKLSDIEKDFNVIRELEKNVKTGMFVDE
eukprot:147782_1